MDCLEGMKTIPNKSIDMILTDLPYGVTNCKWDTVIQFELLWKQYERIIKDRGAMVFTAAQPFTTSLIYSNKRLFKYCWYWIKNQVTGFPFAKYQPLRCVEDVVVFYKQSPIYNPQGLVRLERPIKGAGKTGEDCVYEIQSLDKPYESFYTNYPRQTIHINCQREGLHPTQKPVELFEYLINTYTNPGQLVLDSCIGSGTTAIACINTGRQYVGFETDKKYYDIAIKRVEALEKSSTF